MMIIQSRRNCGLASRNQEKAADFALRLCSTEGGGGESWSISNSPSIPIPKGQKLARAMLINS
jgi:hypothetical protein